MCCSGEQGNSISAQQRLDIGRSVGHVVGGRPVGVCVELFSLSCDVTLCYVVRDDSLCTFIASPSPPSLPSFISVSDTDVVAIGVIVNDPKTTYSACVRSACFYMNREMNSTRLVFKFQRFCDHP